MSKSGSDFIQEVITSLQTMGESIKDYNFKMKDENVLKIVNGKNKLTICIEDEDTCKNRILNYFCDNKNKKSLLCSYPKNDFGPTDERGALNYITPNTLKNAFNLLKKPGQIKIYELGVSVGNFTSVTGRTATLKLEKNVNSNPLTGLSNVDDHFDPLYMGVGTQLDSLAHISKYNALTGTNTWYNDIDVDTYYSESGVSKLGIETIGPIVTRAIILDMTKVFNVVEKLLPSTLITKHHIETALCNQNLEINEGDIVILYTGHINDFDNELIYQYTSPGVDRNGAAYLSSKKIVACGTDSWTTTCFPGDVTDLFGDHMEFLRENGVYILESLDPRKMLEDGHDECVLIVSTPKYKGAVQAQVNPVAIVIDNPPNNC